MAKQKVITDTRDEIVAELEKQERTVTWLSTKTKIAYTTLYNTLKHKISKLDQTRLDKINAVLKTDFKLNEE